MKLKLSDCKSLQHAIQNERKADLCRNFLMKFDNIKNKNIALKPSTV